MIDRRLFMIRILVEAYGADVDAEDGKGRTALFFCMAMPHCLVAMCKETSDFQGSVCCLKKKVSGLL
jgi:hypothetical protein